MVTHKANFADQVASIEDLQESLLFSRQIIHQSQKILCMILCPEDQILDLRWFCCPQPSAVLGIDKIYSLDDLHITVPILKNLAVWRRATGEYSLFCGSIWQTCSAFFIQHLAGRLEDTSHTLVLESDPRACHRTSDVCNFSGYRAPYIFEKTLFDNAGPPQCQRKCELEQVFWKKSFFATATSYIKQQDQLTHIAGGYINANKAR